jgi:hypothetical protein
LLWYRRPASAWEEALPVGNGRLGAMVFGGVARERIQLNEDTLWSGGPRDWNNPEAKAWLPKVREALFAGRYLEANKLCKKMQGPYTQSYQPLGDLHLAFSPDGVVENYRRELDLESGIATTRFRMGGGAGGGEKGAAGEGRRLRGVHGGSLHESRLVAPQFSRRAESRVARKPRSPGRVRRNT